MAAKIATAQILKFPTRPRTPNRTAMGQRIDALVEMLVAGFGEGDPEMYRESLLALRQSCLQKGPDSA